MVNHIVGIMWNKNEGDILPFTIESALMNVDSLIIADDGSEDNSWDIIQSYAKQHKKIEHIQRSPNKRDPGQRQALLNEIRKRYKPENTWVQVIESDIMIVETDIREVINSTTNLSLTWHLLNAVRKPGTWKEEDKYPSWNKPIQEVMPFAHKIESMVYTFRPLPKLYYDPDSYKPWPKGFANYPSQDKKKYCLLLGHYGYRGPTHFFKKYNKAGKKGLRHLRRPDWDLSSPETIENTVSYFNGIWNKHSHPMSREGWVWRKHGGYKP